MPTDHTWTEWFEEMSKPWPNRDVSENKYYPMLDKVLKQTIPGASQVHFLSQTLWSTSEKLPLVRGDKYSLARRKAIHEPHADYTVSKILTMLEWTVENVWRWWDPDREEPLAGSISAQDILDADRILIVNVWCSVSDEPGQGLKVCDARTTSWASSDVVKHVTCVTIHAGQVLTL